MIIVQTYTGGRWTVVYSNDLYSRSGMNQILCHRYLIIFTNVKLKKVRQAIHLLL